jgi:hypothetical protein
MTRLTLEEFENICKQARPFHSFVFIALLVFNSTNHHPHQASSGLPDFMLGLACFEFSCNGCRLAILYLMMSSATSLHF